MVADLLMIVPSRGRPESVARVVKAWEATGAYDDAATLLFAIDADDPASGDYLAQSGERVAMGVSTHWRPMVHKLNIVATLPTSLDHFAVGFAGDDHLPRTPGWAGRYVTELRQLGAGIVYGDDGYQGENLPTQWAMTSNIVRALGRMVPAGVEHLYCDNAIRDLGQETGCLRYLADVLVEHMHPVARKAENDAQYKRVNSPSQYRRDRAAYNGWRATGLERDAATVKTLARAPVEG